jgi:hypothetical protein
MDWRIIFPVGIPGIIMGVLSLFGFTQGIEFWLWLILAIVIAFWIAKKAPARLFLHGLAGGFAAGIANSLVQVLWLDVYRANNPSSMQDFNQLPGDMDVRVFVMIAGIVVGVIYGVLLGLFSWVAGLLLRRRTSTGER